MQLNNRREQALKEVRRILDGIHVFKEISFLVKHPEEVGEFPSAYLATGGDGLREPANLLNTLFDHKCEIIAYIYHKQKVEGELYIELEQLVAKCINALDAEILSLAETQGIDLYVSAIETDEGTLGGTGMTIALAVLTITALLPARDA